MTASLLLVANPASAQEALRNSLAGEAAAEARHLREASPDYTVKSGDFRLLVRPSLSLDWNDNVNTSEDDPDQDFILTPRAELTASYPITRYNALFVSVGVGWREYLEGSRYSGLWLQAGSQVAFDIYVGDFWFNLHDRFSYSQDSSQEPSVAGTGDYGQFLNAAGLDATWDLRDLTLTLAYDHQNDLSTSDQFSYRDRASELVVARAGFRFHPRLIAGLEGTVSFTRYDQPVLNDSVGYSGGLYADYQPGAYFRLQPRVGYALYQFDQTSLFIPADDQNTWYADLTLSHQPTDFISYSLSAGRELRLGTYSDTTEAWYVRPNVSWNVFKHLSLTTYFSYENGTQGLYTLAQNATEDYDWFGGGISLRRQVLKRLAASLSYRFTLRTSSAASREYTQNVVGILLTYQLQ